MPVYLCQSGSGHTEPWRYGIQVYSTPFSIDDDAGISGTGSGGGGGGGGRDLVIAATSWSSADPNAAAPDAGAGGAAEGTNSSKDIPAGPLTRASLVVGHPIRRVRHAEIVLVDDVCVAFDRYWLRLRWPGHKGGFAGYIAMGKVSDITKGLGVDKTPSTFLQSSDERVGPEDNEDETPEERETSSMPPSEPIESVNMTCLRTGLVFQTSQSLRLLSMYDDGVTPAVAFTPFSPEPVFCRICREGLHDDADEAQPAAAKDDREDVPDPSSHSLDDDGMLYTEPPQENVVVVVGGTLTPTESNKGPVQPHPVYSANSEALQNPLLAPCECSGSMAFVHYLCVEQWRCRSRHPEARHGLNCETCGTPYSLPPPSERPAPVDQEDWLEAMPPHVMQALRQPHLCWQIGAAIVRRRWLRPLAPVVMSPIVALYCRARRLLKKRGVARRRWACSLCRRRARWKCVRCLRSYYCSRQCQNVSWHIVHKHVCYKPSRFAQSVVAYGALTLALCPGILQDPFMYNLGLCLIPASFVVMGILGGGLGLVAKRFAGVDIRGRCLELAVVLATVLLSMTSWGLVQGFFGMPQQCHGVMGNYAVTKNEVPRLLRLVSNAILWPTQRVFSVLDAIPKKSAVVRAALCIRNSEGCFAHQTRQEFYLAENDGQACASDLMFVTCLYLLAYFVFLCSAAMKRQDRMRRQRAGPRVPPMVRRFAQVRPHQD